MIKKVMLEIEVDIPEEATHYWGTLYEDPTFVKMKMIADYPHWFEYIQHQKEWLFIQSGDRPRWLKDIPPTV